MRVSNDALQYPPHYPPTDRWKKFFIGVRVLGPDLSFFKDLEKQQGVRTQECMKAWKTNEQYNLAIKLGRAFKEDAGWPTEYFLPDDHLEVIAGGPQFFDTDDSLNFFDALIETGEQIGLDLSQDSWSVTHVKTLGEMVEEILKRQKR